MIRLLCLLHLILYSTSFHFPELHKVFYKVTTTQRPSWTPSKRPTRPTVFFPVSTSTTPLTTHRWTRPTTQSHPTRFTTTARPIVVTKPTQKPERQCQHGQYYAYPNSCTNFFVCVNGDLISQQCGPGLNWNREKNMCDWAFKNPCTDINRKNALLVTKETTSCVPGSYTSVPGDCKSYQACLWGRHEVFQCAPGLHFNKETRICDWPSRANCEEDGGKTETMTEPTTKKPARPTSRPTDKPSYLPVTTTTERVTWTQSTTQGTTLPSAVIDPDKVSPLSGHFKVVCYFTNWAWYRRGIGRYLPENIDHTLCTHIVYGFAVLDYSELVIRAHDSWADFDNRFYERVVAYKKRGLKVLLALGGWNDSAGDKYSRLVNSQTARKKFAKHALDFVEKYGFDGLDLDWEYPVCWQVDCKKGPASDKESFAALLKELKDEFKEKGLLLTAAVSPSKKVVDKGYDVPALAKYLDWIAVMTYDFHGQWDKKTGHVAPLYYHPDDEFYYFNANYSINYWIAKGAPPRSIVMGMPLYGQSFTINDPKAGIGLNAPASAGNAGEFTKASGFLSYYEICDRVRNRGWTLVQDPEKRMGPYAYKGSQWVSFDDAEMIRKKAQFVRDLGLGGGMVWALDLDDFRGRCGESPHPLLHTLQQVLAAPPNEHDKPIKPPSSEAELERAPPTSYTTPSSLSTSTETEPGDQVEETGKDEFIIPCYFTNWAWYRPNYGKYLPKDIDPALCTHIIYGFAVLDGSSFTIKSYDPWADLDNKFYELVVKYKEKGLKVLIAIGGWNDSAGDKYSRLVNSPSARSRFVTQVIQFIEKYGFDGLDLDWEYPVCWQVDCKKGPKSDKKNFALLVEELSEAFKPKGLLLSSAVSPSKRVIDAGYDVPTLAKHMDWISVMAYDYHGQWDKKTGHVAPLYALPDDWEPTFNANFSVHYWLEQGVPPKKLVMGVPLYGQSFSLAERTKTGLNAPTYGGGEAGEATRARGFLAYYEICERTLTKGWTVVQDKERRIGPYAYKADQWVSFDDAEQIRLKAEYIKEMGLAGGMIWALDLDDFRNICGCEPYPLLRTLNRVLRNYPKGPVCPIKTEITLIDVSPSTTETAVDSSSNDPSHPSYLPPEVTTPETTTEIDDTVEIEASLPTYQPPIGDCDGRLFIPHNSDCSKYLVCNFGKLSEHSCPNGLYWNNDRCDWPENTKCKDSERQINASMALISSKNEGTKKVICYVTSWASMRPEGGKFSPEDIEPSLCTHIVYGFAVLDAKQLIMKVQDSIGYKNFLERITDLKNKSNAKVLIALGGWRDSKDEKYSKLAGDASARKKFARHASQFIQKHGFDGLDLVWEYPVCWQGNCKRGPHSDKEAYALLLKELSFEFKSKGLLLSAAVSPDKEVVSLGYNVTSLVKYLDWITVMTYDYHGYWEGKTGHIAPLGMQLNDDHDHNVLHSMKYWIRSGMPSTKLIIGIPAYGQSFTIASNQPPRLGAVSSGPGKAGKFSRVAGFLAYYEICDNIKNYGWIVVKDFEKRHGPYAWKDNQWVSYDDVTDVIRKTKLITDLNLAGGALWTLDLDDFQNRCGCGKYPLLANLKRGVEEKRQEAHTTDCT